ncbi:MoaD/ThiS family protein [Candidatus Bathyarchaeota archaeon]|nr:MoaD/ThiS family protein [Candidatus Bathyarchaeota archaeon]
MYVTIRYLSVIREITGTREEVIEVDNGATVEDVLKMLSKKYGKSFDRMIRSGRDIRGLQIIYFIDGKNIANLDGFKTAVNDESELVIIPPVAGG